MKTAEEIIEYLEDTIPSSSNKDIAEDILRWIEEAKEEIRVYVAPVSLPDKDEAKEIDFDEAVKNSDMETIKNFTKEYGEIYTIFDFASACNNDYINFDTNFILID